MANSRIIVNLSPSFIKVMPFECKGKNELILTSYTNSFEQVKKGMVCIFQAENTNDNEVTIELSKVKDKIKLLSKTGGRLQAGALRAGDFYEASYDGANLILHESKLNITAGSNVHVQRSKEGDFVISADNIDTWRPIGDSLETGEKDKSASLYALKILNEKCEAVKKIIENIKIDSKNKELKIEEIKKTIDTLSNEIKKEKSSLLAVNEKVTENEKKNQELEGELTETKKNLNELADHVAEVGNSSYIKVKKNSHGFATGDILVLNGTIWELTKVGEVGQGICIGIDSNNFAVLLSGIREYRDNIKDYLGKDISLGVVYYCSGTSGKCTSTKPIRKGQIAFICFENSQKKYIKNLLNGKITDFNLITKDETNELLKDKSNANHNHDEKYKNKSEFDAYANSTNKILENKADKTVIDLQKKEINEINKNLNSKADKTEITNSTRVLNESIAKKTDKTTNDKELSNIKTLIGKKADVEITASLKKEITNISNSKENKIIRTAIAENDNNKVFTGKGALDLKNWLVSGYTNAINNLKNTFDISLGKKLNSGGFSGTAMELMEGLREKVDTRRITNDFNAGSPGTIPSSLAMKKALEELKASKDGWNNDNCVLTKGENSYQLLASGLIIQRGVSYQPSNEWVKVTFPIAFKESYCVAGISNCPWDGAQSPTIQQRKNKKVLTSFQWFVPGGAGWTCDWIAIGI